ncbi:MAG: adenine deaminase [Saprospiraceae bacterium]
MGEKISGQLVDIPLKKVYGVTLYLEGGIIQSIEKTKSKKGSFIIPGFVDAHIHIESSMLAPSEFAKLALPFGTLATVSDPHEIANIMGLEGIYFMMENAEDLPLNILFGAPSCVPASNFETSGARLNARDVDRLLSDPRIGYLSEVMNYPGVIHRDPTLMSMIASAKQHKKPVDGHAPGLRGTDLINYFSAGIQTDHECFTYDEALEKINLGMKVIIREGSAAKNYVALAPLIAQFPDKIMFCSDDKHPDDLIKGHINQIVARAVQDGYNLFDVLQIACINPKKHYHFSGGTLQENDPADFVLIEDLESFHVNEVYVSGKLVAKDGQSWIETKPIPIINKFNCRKIVQEDLEVRALAENIAVIEALDGQLITNALSHPARILNGKVIADPKNDILKIIVLNRYQPGKPAIGFVKGFGLKAGAIASCVAHDSHNIIAVGIDDESICRVVNKIIDQKGGIAAALNTFVLGLELPIGGIMSTQDGISVAKQYSLLDHFARTDLKSTFRAPFMTLSFMALPVIPALKMTDKGLFDGSRFEWTPLFM